MHTKSNAATKNNKTDALAAYVLRDGWFKSRASATDNDLRCVAERIARQLGELIPSRNEQRVEPLAPTEESNAHSRSLSAKHGRGSFPMHTDGAHWLLPPRFVVLVCVSPGTRPVPTTLLRFRDLALNTDERVRLEATPFLVRNGRRSFYSTICSASRPFIRFDEGCMVPQDTAGQEILRVVGHRSREAAFVPIDWRTGDFLVLDNWNVLHGRGLGDTEASPDRKLLRVSVQ
jgi:alpha-ketoglutarate-dependent taurine dioxygenase